MKLPAVLYHATDAPPELILRDGLLVDPPEEWLAGGMGWDEETEASWCTPGVYGFDSLDDAEPGRCYLYALDVAGLTVERDTPNLPGAWIVLEDVAPARIAVARRNEPRIADAARLAAAGR